MINLDIDFGPITEALDGQRAMLKTLESKRSRNLQTVAMGLVASSAFNLWMDRQANERPMNLHHVYEWGQTGEMAGRLWYMVLVGSGGTRVLNSVFIQSDSIVPAGAAHSGIEGDTRKMVHRFRWKAPMMESGARVSITAKNAKVLAWPNGGEMKFRKGPWNFQLGQGTRGQFTEAWNAFFGEPSQVVIDEELVKPMKREIYTSINKDLYKKLTKRGKTKSATPGIHIHIKPKKNMAKVMERSMTKLQEESLRKAKAKARASRTML